MEDPCALDFRRELCHNNIYIMACQAFLQTFFKKFLNFFCELFTRVVQPCDTPAYIVRV